MYHYSSKASILQCSAFFMVQLSHPYMSTGKTMTLNPVNPKGNQSWLFIGRTIAEAKAPVFQPANVKNWLIWKDPGAGKDWRQEKWTAEDETVGWHHQPDENEFEQAPGVSDGQWSLACCSPWSHKESDMPEWLNWTELSSLLLTTFL